MNFIKPNRFVEKVIFGVASVLLGSAPSSFSNPIALESGYWSEIQWTSGAAPNPGDQVHISNGMEVNHNSSERTRVGRILIGSDSLSGSANGTLTVSNGVLQTASNGSLAIQVGQGNASIGTLNVTGGDVIADNGGWLTVGNGLDSTGVVNLTAGSIQTDQNAIALGSAAGSTGSLNMSGGNLEVAGTLFVGRTHLHANTGRFNQSAGTARIDGPLRIGNATGARHPVTGLVRLAGGSTTVAGNIAIANTITGQLGQGKLSIAAGASLVVSGDNSTLIVGDRGELEFLLGGDSHFNVVDLTAVKSGPALSFLENSHLRVDGRGFTPGSLAPIQLITYSRGHGPSAVSIANLSYHFIDFNPALNPSLEWTDTGLMLILQ